MSDLLQYFGVEHGYDIRWAHAANSRYQLRRAIEDTSIHVVEVDVQLARDGLTLICAHPPDTSSDLSLLECIDTLWGKAAQTVANRKGLKLDFKSSAAVKHAASLLPKYLIPCTSSLKDEGDPEFLCNWPPLILNADVLTGPGVCPQADKGAKQDTQSNTVDWQELLVLSENLPFAIVSIGWTTAVPTVSLSGGAFNKKRTNDGSSADTVSYDENMVKEMAEVAGKFCCPVMFVFRACYVLKRKDIENWWEANVLPALAGTCPKASFDDDGDVVRSKTESEPEGKVADLENKCTIGKDEKVDHDSVKTDLCTCVGKRSVDISFLLWSHARDDIDGSLLQQFVLRETSSLQKHDKSLSRSTCGSCGKLRETLQKRCLFLDLHAKHLGLLDYWELAEYMTESTSNGPTVDTMSSVIMKHVANKYPNNKRFRYT